MSKTSNEVKERWESANYKKFLVRFRNDTDKELIAYIDANKNEIGTTEIFRQALTKYIKKASDK